MGDFSNQFQQAGYNADDYIQRLLALIGDRDPLQLLGELARQVETMVAGMDDATRADRRRKGSGRWSKCSSISPMRR